MSYVMVALAAHAAVVESCISVNVQLFGNILAVSHRTRRRLERLP